MRLTAVALLVLVFVGVAVRGVHTQAPPPEVTEAEYQRWTKELSNWGRWGADDQIGALNLITPDKRRQAAALVTEGVTDSLAADTAAAAAAKKR